MSKIGLLVLAFVALTCALPSPLGKPAKTDIQAKVDSSELDVSAKKQYHRAGLVVGEDEQWEPPVVRTSMKIGTPGVNFLLQVDQYFEDIILKGPSCTSLSCKGLYGNRTTYDPSKSSSSKDQGDPAKIRYGSSITGEYYTDNLEVDGIKDKDVALAVLKTASSQFYRVPFDGVFGMSFLSKPRGKKNFQSPVDSILKSSDTKILNLWFNKATKNEDRYGLLTFGKVNTEKCNSDIKYSIVSDDDFTFRVQKVRFGNFVAHRELNARISPESPHIGLPTTLYKDLLRVATGYAQYNYVSCDKIKGMTIDIKIGGIYYTLQLEDFTYDKVVGSTHTCYFLIEDNGDEFDSGFLLGEPFFRRYCITYDVENNQIGFSSIKAK